MDAVAVVAADAEPLEEDVAADAGSSDHTRGQISATPHSHRRLLYICLVLSCLFLPLLSLHYLAPYHLPLMILPRMILTTSGRCQG